MWGYAPTAIKTGKLQSTSQFSCLNQLEDTLTCCPTLSSRPSAIIASVNRLLFDVRSLRCFMFLCGAAGVVPGLAAVSHFLLGSEPSVVSRLERKTWENNHTLSQMCCCHSVSGLMWSPSPKYKLKYWNSFDFKLLHYGMCWIPPNSHLSERFVFLQLRIRSKTKVVFLSTGISAVCIKLTYLTQW